MVNRDVWELYCMVPDSITVALKVNLVFLLRVHKGSEQIQK